MSHSNWRRRSLALLTVAAVGVGMVAVLGPLTSGASSHREAPLIAADPQVDNTDVYAFVSPDDPNTVTIITNWLPFEEPAGGPNFYVFDPNARYDVNIDNDGDGVAEIVYRWTFRNTYRNTGTFLYNTGPVTTLDDADLNFIQTYDLIEKRGKNKETLVNDGPVVPNNVGAASMPDFGALFDAGVTSVAGGGSAWAGQSDDPFFLDLRVFDLLYGADFGEAGDDTLAGFNVQTMAMQVPSDALAKRGNAETNPIIGVWSTASRRQTRVLGADGSQTHDGKWRQVSRLGMPLVNEVVIPLEQKDFWNASKPKDDLENFGAYVLEPHLPDLIEAVYGIDAPATPRNDLVQVFVTGIPELNQPAGVVPSEMIRLNMSTPPCELPACNAYSALGVIGGDVAGFPNGRRLADDTIDIALQVVEGELVGSPNDLADGVNENDVPFLNVFPYVALPHSGSDAAPH